MSSFFRGWKRRLAVVCLALACLVMVEWVRSSISPRGYSFPLGRQFRDVVVTRDSRIYWIVSGNVRFPLLEYSLDVTAVVLDFDGDELAGNRSALKHDLWMTYIYHQSGAIVQTGNLKLRVTVIPFWLTTTPLILLAVFLLFLVRREIK